MSEPQFVENHPVRRDATTEYVGPKATYACRTCGFEKAVPEKPIRAAPER